MKRSNEPITMGKVVDLSNLDYENVVRLIRCFEPGATSINMTNLEFSQTDGLVLLTLFLVHQGRIGVIPVRLCPIKAESCPLTYMNRVHFFNKVSNYIELDSEDKDKLNTLSRYAEYNSDNFTPLIDRNDEYGTLQNLDHIVDVFVGYLARIYAPGDDTLDRMKDIINENFLNVRNHSNIDLPPLPYYCAQIQCYASKRFRLAIGDLGMGIMESLNTVHSYPNSESALRAVTKEPVSRFQAVNLDRGGGIRHIFDYTDKLNIGCRLRSGDAETVQFPGIPITERKTVYFPGTQLFLWK